MRRRVTLAVAVILLVLPTTALAQEAETSVSSHAVERDRSGEQPSEEGSPTDEPSASGPSESASPSPEPTAEETPTDETGIGEPDAVECRGTVTAEVVDLDGTPVAGGLMAVAGERVESRGSVELGCGEVAATLLSAPDGYAAAGPTTATVQVRHEQVAAVRFQVDPVEVLGTQPSPPQPDAAPAPAQPGPQPTPQAATPELAATGATGTGALLALALLLTGAGIAMVATPRVARAR